MKSITTILVPTDFSELSFVGMEFVISMATSSNAHIYILHVVPATVPVASFPDVDLNSETVVRDAVSGARKEMRGLIVGRFKDLPNVTGVVRRGEPSKEIVGYAHEIGADVIVIATHGRTGIVHALIGSIAERVVRHSAVPVLTVKPQALHEIGRGKSSAKRSAVRKKVRA